MQQTVPASSGMYWALGMLSAAIIAYQLALIQLFSCQQWYHFAYMVISVALLGFGVAGTVLSLFEKWLVRHYPVVFPVLLSLTAVAMVFANGLSNLEVFRFDSYLLFNDPAHLGHLAATCLLFFLPFFLGALAIGLAFVRFSAQIGTVYFANLLGSGLGGILGVLLMWVFSPTALPVVVAALPVLAMLLLRPPRTALLGLAGAAIGYSYILLHLPDLKPSEYKAISKTLLLPDARIKLEENTPYGLIQLVSSPALRYAPGLSLTYQQAVVPRDVLFHNGDWLGSILPWRDTTAGRVLDYTTRALPYRTKQPASVLVLNAGSGEDVVHALPQGASQVAVVEPDAALLSLLKHELAAETDSLLYHPAVRVYGMEARTFLLTDTSQFDLIVLPPVGAFGGTAGLNALQEQYTLTLEAFEDAWDKLRPGGSMTLTCWIEYPPRSSLKVLATLLEMLEKKDVRQARQHLAAVKSWGTITFLASKQPITGQTTAAVRTFCQDMQFDPVLLPDLHGDEREQFNQMQDSSFFASIDALLSDRRNAFYESYAFNIRPAHDQRPYFSQFLRLKSLPRLAESFGEKTIPFLEVGYLLVLVTLALLGVVALILIILPLLRFRIAASNRRWIFLYFSGIGIGYMFVEIVFIQQFLRFLGNPVYSAAAVISCLLVASGVGSYFSERLRLWGKPLLYAPLLVASLLLVYAVVLPAVLQYAMGSSGLVKFLVMLAITAPPGFLMGIPFPSGIRFLAAQEQAPVAGKKNGAIPWAWGINGYFSVISTALATVIAVELGFLWVLMLAGLAYGVAAVAWFVARH